MDGSTTTPPASYIEYQRVQVAGAQGWWLVPGEERTAQRINVAKYPEWSGAEARCDLAVPHNGEAGSGGKLQRLRPEQVDELIAVLQQARARMGGR